MNAAPILVTGATGTVGREITRQLTDAGHPVRVLTRNRQRAESLNAAVEVVDGDLEKPDTLAQAFTGIETVFILSVGPQLPVMERNAYQAAHRAGVANIVKLSGRHGDTDFMMNTPLATWHRESEQTLRSLDIRWTIVRPGAFASNFLGWLDPRDRTIALPAGDSADTFIDPRDIAAVCATALTTPGHDGRIYEITGTERITFTQAAKTLSDIIGEPVTYRDVAPSTVRDAMLAAGAPPGYIDSILEYFAALRSGRLFSPTTTVEEVTGRPAYTFEDWARHNIKEFHP